MKYRVYIALFIALIFCTGEAFAQIIPPADEPESAGEYREVQSSVLPIAGYSSDYGLFGGVFYLRRVYEPDADLFLSQVKSEFRVSTKGDLVGKFDYETMKSFGGDIHSSFTFLGERVQLSNYFGIGNDTQFSKEEYDNDFFSFERRELFLKYRGRKTLYEFENGTDLDFSGSVSVAVLDASAGNGTTKFGSDKPGGTGLGWVNKPGIGFILENTDSERLPENGFRYEAGFENSGVYTGSDYSFSEVHADLRHYIRLMGSVVLAQKIEAKHIFGDAPFWELPALGDNMGLRGFHRSRFIGDSSVLHIVELRTWLFSLLGDAVKIGGHLFWDTGRVYSQYDSGVLLDDWKHSFGAGGALSVFDSDFILRGDLGFSDETYKINFGIGYLF